MTTEVITTTQDVPMHPVSEPQQTVVASLQSVTKAYGTHVALDTISFDLRKGEIIALLGPNGAGKTTSVRLMLGLTQVTAGVVQVFGRDPRERATRMRIGAM